VERQQQRHHQGAAQPLFADVDSDSVQAAIQRLFDRSIMLEDSMFCDFFGASCKSLEMVSIQSGIDVGVGSGTGEDVLDVAEDDIQSSSTTATSLVTSRTGRFSGIHILRTLVRYVHLPLSFPIENRLNSGLATLASLAWGASLRSNFNVSCIGHGTPSLHTSLFSITPQRRLPST
jgi:hypothetical protein